LKDFVGSGALESYWLPYRDSESPHFWSRERYGWSNALQKKEKDWRKISELAISAGG
jgi:hypothetical protein